MDYSVPTFQNDPNNTLKNLIAGVPTLQELRLSQAVSLIMAGFQVPVSILVNFVTGEVKAAEDPLMAPLFTPAFEAGGGYSNGDKTDLFIRPVNASGKTVNWIVPGQTLSVDVVGGIPGISDVLNPDDNISSSLLSLIDRLESAGVAEEALIIQESLDGIHEGLVWVTSEEGIVADIYSFAEGGEPFVGAPSLIIARAPSSGVPVNKDNFE